MPVTSTVEWEGLTRLVLDLTETIPRQSNQAIYGMTQELGELTHLRYRENLEGSVPSTEEEPLPVGIRSGDLYAGAEFIQLNQFAWIEKNEVDHAGWIEEGTEHMAARHPLQDAVDILEKQMDVELDKVMRDIIET